MRHTHSALVGLALAGVLLAGCTVQQTEAPPLSGPSELALSIVLQAVPDLLTQDGVSQSVILIEARGPDGRPVRALPVRAEVLIDGALADYGTLSAKTLVTDDDGRARLTYTAPPGASESVDAGTIVTVIVTPIGGDHRGARARQVDIRLVPLGIILPPNGAPVPSFVVTPTPVSTFTPVTFDASGTTDGGVPCGGRCSYAWNFGDGGSGTGELVTHEYRAVGTYTARLTVTDARGASASATLPVSVSQSTAPTASFTFSPQNPAVSQDIFFTAEASRAAIGRRIILYDWNFGSGRTGAGVTVSKRYDTPGSYNVTLTVTDDAQQEGTTTQTVTVGSSGTGIVPALTSSPTNPGVGTVVTFDATATRGPDDITHYEFAFGDNTVPVIVQSPAVPRVTHQFAAPGTYVVRATMRDSAGRTATITVNVVVS